MRIGKYLQGAATHGSSRARSAFGGERFFGPQKIQVSKDRGVVLFPDDPAASAAWIMAFDFAADFHDDLADALWAGAVPALSSFHQHDPVPPLATFRPSTQGS